MINGVCGFDQWVDNHIAIDGRGTPSLSEIAELFEQNGFHYHWWKTPGAYQIYAVGKKKILRQKRLKIVSVCKAAHFSSLECLIAPSLCLKIKFLGSYIF
jgi:hypothetical protein